MERNYILKDIAISYSLVKKLGGFFVTKKFDFWNVIANGAQVASYRCYCAINLDKEFRLGCCEAKNSRLFGCMF